MNVKQFIRVLVTVTAVLLTATYAVAQGNGGGNGNGGGGQGGGGNANYNLVRLAYPDATTTSATQLNDRANVAGTYRDADDMPYGFHYDFASGDYTSLGELTSARGINQLDNIVGHSLVTYNNGQEDVLIPGRGLYWDAPNTVPIVLPPLTDDTHDDTHSNAVAVNDARIIIGESYTPSTTFGNKTLVAWYVRADDSVMGPVPLPFLEGDIEGRAADLTEETAGVTLVVGTSSTVVDSSTFSEPVSWTVTRTDSGLTVTGPAVFVGTYLGGRAFGVNNFGDAVGGAALQESQAVPFVRIAGQPMVALPLLPWGHSGHASSINDSGQIVGSTTTSRPHHTLEQKATLWTNSTTVVDLNSQVKLAQGEELEAALDINNRTPRGDILAILDPYYSTPCLLIAK